MQLLLALLLPAALAAAPAAPRRCGPVLSPLDLEAAPLPELSAAAALPETLSAEPLASPLQAPELAAAGETEVPQAAEPGRFAAAGEALRQWRESAPMKALASGRDTAGALGKIFGERAFSAGFEAPSAEESRGLKARLIRELATQGRGRVEVETQRRNYTYGRSRYRLEYWFREQESLKAPVAARFGPLFFVQDSAYRALSPGLREALSGRVIRMRTIEGSGVFSPLAEYSLTAVAAMLSEGVAGKRVIDAGAGDGLLSLVAARLGAKRLDLLEYDPEALRRAGADLALNGLVEGRDYFLRRADLTDRGKTLAGLGSSPLPAVLVATIGNWSSDYTAANADVFALLPDLKRVELIIASGYASGAPNGGMGHLSWDLALLRRLGWKAGPAMGSRGVYEPELGGRGRNNYFHRSFVARQDPALRSDRAAFEAELQRRLLSHRTSLSAEVLRRLRR